MITIANRSLRSLVVTLLLLCALFAGGIRSADAALGDPLLTYGAPYQFVAPQGVAVDPVSGLVYVADGGSRYLSVFDVAGNLVRRQSPPDAVSAGGVRDIAVSPPTGWVYTIGGSGQGIISIYDANGNYIGAFGREGAGNGLFYYATCLAVSEAGEVFVADGWNDNLQVFDAQGNFLRSWRVAGLYQPEGMAFDAAGRLYLVDYYSSGVMVFDPATGVRIRQWDLGYLNSFRGDSLAIDHAAGELYALNALDNRIYAVPLDAAGGPAAPPRIIGDPASPDTGLSAATDIALGPGGSLYVAMGDSYSINYSMVKHLDTAGGYRGVWRAWGDAPGRFTSPTAGTVDADGRVYVADTGNRRVQVLDAGGAFLSTFPIEPMDILDMEVSGAGEVYLGGGALVDGVYTYFARVYDRSGTLLRQLPLSVPSWSGRFGGLAVDGDRLYFSNGELVQVLSASTGAQTGYLYASSMRGTRDVEVGPDGTVAVVDAFGIVRFSSAGVLLGRSSIGGLAIGVVSMLAVDTCGNAYSLTSPQSYYDPGTVRVFDTAGQALGQWGAQGIETGQFRAPLAVAAGALGRIYVVERDNHRVQVFEGVASCGRPIASAGLDLTTHPGRTVTFDGSGSSDPLRQPISYRWQITGAPQGSIAQLSDPSSPAPAFTPDLLGEYRITLTVTAERGAASEPDEVLVTAVNAAPTVSAGPDQAIVVIGTTVLLAGSGFDDDGDPLTYAWSFDAAPAGSTAQFSDPQATSTSFVADRHGDYIARLTASDPWGGVTGDTVLVSFTNVPPVAEAGLPRTVVQGSAVHLNGAGSSDANGDPLLFAWQLTVMPAGSAAVLTGADSAAPFFTADIPGEYVITLVVNDGFTDSTPDAVTVTAVSTETALYTSLANLLSVVNAAPEAAFANPSHRKALGNLINSAIARTEAGNYTGALAQMRTAVLPRMNDCNPATADNVPDWIVDCAVQAEAYRLVVEAIDLLTRLLA